MVLRLETFTDGYALHADSTDQPVQSYVETLTGKLPLVIADPPYGNILNVKWDRINIDDSLFSDWMIKWTRAWTARCLPAAAFYVWGGLGKPGFRPFVRFLSEVEQRGKFELSNLITWKKKRAYGTQNNYLYTREECAYFVNGCAKKPRLFNVPLLAEKRGYAGYNVKYPAKSEFYRRTNVWTDITEVMRNKKHVAQKAQRLYEIMIEVHTNPGEWVLDPFAGCGTAGLAARATGRKFFLIENDVDSFDAMVKLLRVNEPVKV